MGPPGLFVKKNWGKVVGIKGLLLHQEAREAARVRPITDTHRSPLQTPPHESTQSARKAKYNPHSLTIVKHNTTYFNKSLPQEVQSHKVLQRDIPPYSEVLTILVVTSHFTQNHTLPAQN